LIFLFGGTFDPVHNGHLEAARAAARLLDAPQVRMLLAARPRHRVAPGATIAQRFEMLELACAPWPELVADDFEIRAGGPSYTVETLVALRARHVDATLVWIMGMDAFAEMGSWRRAGEVLDFCHIAVLKRPGAARPSGAMLELLEANRVDRLPDRPAGAVIELEADLPDVSASAIRVRLARGESVEHLLPRAVRTYIHRHGLYQVRPSGAITPGDTA
jgi:nicotinate-nucleotide adenylyltransferase